jgi:GNAT superfamily N-acetyltransferase
MTQSSYSDLQLGGGASMRSSKSNPFHIRPAEMRDLDAICALIQLFLKRVRADASVEGVRRVMEQIIKSPGLGVVVVAENDTGLCGYGYASFPWRSEFGGETMDIVELFVEESWRNKGVGRSLVAALLETARQRNIRRISAEVHPGNAAIERTLESCGFDPERRTLWGMDI